MKRVVQVRPINSRNLNTYMLSAYASWEAEKNHVVVYNTLFDTATHLILKEGCDASKFMHMLEEGIDSLESSIGDWFSQPADDVYRLLVLKKIIE